jgi:3-oxoacyl-[acyl-carrier-protein] synthase III
MASLRSLAVRRTAPRPVNPGEVAPESGWRGVCEDPGRHPAHMAIEAGHSALAVSGASAAEVEWVLHCGSGPQGGRGWPVHHHIQNALVGGNGNALEVKQNCAGGLTSWLIGSRLVGTSGVAVSTGADNWSWSDRFVNSRQLGGEPMSDAAHAVVLGGGGGFATILGSGSASRAAGGDDWRTRDAYWEATRTEDFHGAYARATTARTEESMKDSFGMFVRAMRAALTSARVSPQYVTHFVPQGSGSGQPYRALAKVVGVPWLPALHEHGLDHGYFGVSAQAEGLICLTEQGELHADAIVLLLASEYQVAATAVVLAVHRRPRLATSDLLRTIS